ncbi:MAG: TetR family transcriptional regulator [Moraxellaceae bacterium]|jgi:AcrR family transcriptional regulator|nr:TetR family transcriptional regulator [Moraxellaceae bacterium]MDF3029787.1 TetR family transcriptional regulator [Moraxellaceae bacterium]
MTRHETLRADTDRERILFASARLFREYGFDKTTVRQIAEACNLLPGSLHYRYRAKEDILVDMMRVAIEKTIRGITEASVTTQDPLQQVRAALQAHIEVLLSGDDMMYVLLFEWRSLRGAARKEMIRERDRYERCWATMLEALKEQGFIRPDVDTHLLRLIGLGAINWMATWYKKGGRYSLDEIGESLWSVISRGILAPKYIDMRKT